MFKLQIVYSQNIKEEVTISNTSKKSYKKREAIHFIASLVSPHFIRQNDKVQLYEPDFRHFRSGLQFSILDYRYYSLWLNAVYAGKGANETFVSSTGEISVEAKTLIHYAQFELIPVVIKSGISKINPYIFVGGYYGWRVGEEKDFSLNGKVLGYSERTEFLSKNDYGYILGGGIILFKIPIELRYSVGLQPISNYSDPNKNFANSTFSIGFIL